MSAPLVFAYFAPGSGSGPFGASGGAGMADSSLPNRSFTGGLVIRPAMPSGKLLNKLPAIQRPRRLIPCLHSNYFGKRPVQSNLLGILKCSPDKIFGEQASQCVPGRAPPSVADPVEGVKEIRTVYTELQFGACGGPWLVV